MTKNQLVRLARALTCLSALACSPALAQPAPDAAATPEASASAQNSIKLARVIMALPAGELWLTLKIGNTFCGYPVRRTATGGREPQDLPPYAASFKTELESAGYKVVTPGEDNLFDPEAGSSDLQAAAVITDTHVEACVSPGALFGSAHAGDVHGNADMKIDWQIYSPIKKQVVAHISTSGSVQLDTAVPGGAQRLILDAFKGNVRQLASSAEFRAALSSPKALTKGFVLPGQQNRIVLAGSLKAGKRPVADAVASVVTIFASSGSGSGDLVSSDGYMITNAHVVGDEKQVRVRWSDGIETVADVIRVAKDRDVALIKTNPRDRDPLPLKRGPVTPGARVYAIGSPLGKSYQGTVSSGIISATRVMEGLRYIQSDVSVTHGSSGGALLDENGAMIGITVAGDQRASGLNFFIPIGDVMDFLSLEQQ